MNIIWCGPQLIMRDIKKEAPKASSGGISRFIWFAVIRGLMCNPKHKKKKNLILKSLDMLSQATICLNSCWDLWLVYY